MPSRHEQRPVWIPAASKTCPDPLGWLSAPHSDESGKGKTVLLHGQKTKTARTPSESTLGTVVSKNLFNKFTIAMTPCEVS